MHKLFDIVGTGLPQIKGEGDYIILDQTFTKYSQYDQYQNYLKVKELLNYYEIEELLEDE